MSATVPSLAMAAGDFSVEGEWNGRTLSTRFRGNADLRARQALDNALTALHAEARRIGARDVAVDLSRLEFMNSSCFKSFVSWINRVQEMDAGARYQIRLLSNPALHWQKRSLHALQCFATDLVQIEST